MRRYVLFADAKKTGSLRNYEFAFGYDENAIECNKYIQKPDAVVSGGECPLFESGAKG
ncbi:MAG: hypothetical protein IJ054_02575 [Lachnospiraceae bacterium]|nr:hypothetical protein [Lachnospiraceae bacterium]MBQ9234777.1 hypothetical protein [Lachnospiraceae bacterium]MBQ9608720.1 hypothetical protein [Lachnospiraceae bacterium]